MISGQHISQALQQMVDELERTRRPVRPELRVVRATVLTRGQRNRERAPAG